jgi:uncharacterized protein YecE (DUF72 family)
LADIHVGTSGWHYGHWVGPFYPPGTRPEDFLAYLAGRFGAVEINSSFYRLPSPAALAEWRDATPPGFVFAVKASRYITHMKKLKEPVRSGRRFFAAVETLGGKLGPILFQLPPRWHVDAPRLAAFLAALPRRHRYAFEFRDETWFAPEVYALLTRHNAALCLYDLAGHHAPTVVTADFVYVRLHGPGAAYCGSYDGRTLSSWARRFHAWRDAGRDVYCFFDNDEKGFAALDALRLKAML